MDASPDDLIGRARALVPALRARAAATEAARRMSDDTMTDLRAAGLFRVLQPRRHGGLEGDLDLFARLVLEIGRGCGSTAWVYSVVAMHQWHLGMFSGEAQDDVWARDAGTIVSSAYAPSGTATVATGGYRLRGAWGFASACDTTGWVIVGGRIVGDGSAQTGQAFFLLPKADYAI